MSERDPLAAHDFASGDLEAALAFLKRVRSELRMLTHVRVATDWFRVYDVNGDSFEIRGVGYPDPDIIPILRLVNTAYKPESIHAPFDQPYKELKTGRRHCWAEDRVM